MPITSGWVPPHLLYAQVLDNREMYQPQIAALRKVGLEDPSEEIPEIIDYVQKLFRRSKPRTQFEKAILLFCSILPSNKTFKIGKREHSGLKGGLEIPYNTDQKARARVKYGSLLPKHLINLPKDERVATCLEYSFLLTALLQAAGIKAGIKREGKHSYVIAWLGDKKYKLDAVEPSFKLAFEDASTYGECVSAHYNNKGMAFKEQGRLDEAIEAFDIALEIYPEFIEIQANRSSTIFYKNLDGIIRFFAALIED